MVTLVTDLVTPGAGLAQADITMNLTFQEISTVVVRTLTEAAPNTYVLSAKTVLAKGDAAPAAGEASLQSDGVTLRIGDATIVSDDIVVVGTPVGGGLLNL